MTDFQARLTTADATVSAYRGVALTKSDTAVIPNTKGLHIGVGGDIAVTMNDGSIVTYKNCISGLVYPYQITQLRSTNTTATDVVALY